MTLIRTPSDRAALTRRATLKTGLALGLAGASGAMAAESGRRPPLVRVESGDVQGYWVDGVAGFKGIPYGGPVDGAGRWKRPVRPQSWSGVFHADHYGPRAFQNDEDNFRIMSRELVPVLMKDAPPADQWATMGENCLTLNIWSPALGGGAKLPVMFWCHGGGFFAETPPLWWNEGAPLAKAGEVVVVTVRHRLGPFGFLDLAGLGAKDLPDAGNAGMLDLVRALEWVHDNIKAFGGDAGNVTIFGESGGGAKVSALLAMPSAKGLFHKAAIQSGPGLRAMEPAAATQHARAVVQAAGAPLDVERFRGLSAAQIVAAQSASGPDGIGGGPVVDGISLLSHPFDPEAPAISADVPIIVGTNRTEATLLLSGVPGIYDLSWDGVAQLAPRVIGPEGPALVEAYRKIHPAASPSETLLLISTDRMMRLPSIQLAERKARQKRAPVYMYLLSYDTDAMGGKLHSPHGLDMPFIFNNTQLGLAGDKPDKAVLARQMCGAWTAFAHTGKPDHPSLPRWAPYSAEDRATMVFDVNPAVVRDPGRAERLALLGAAQSPAPPR